VLDVAAAVEWLPREALEIVVADAFTYIRTCEQRYDYVAVDLFRGEALDARVFGKPFLRRVRALLQPRGQLVFNMFTDIRMLSRINSIATFFEVRATLRRRQPGRARPPAALTWSSPASCRSAGWARS